MYMFVLPKTNTKADRAEESKRDVARRSVYTEAPSEAGTLCC